MTTADMVAAAVLFGPGAASLPALAVAWHRSQHHAAAERALFAELDTHQPTAAQPTPPTGPGQPIARPAAEPADGGTLAPVIDLTTRRRAA